MNRRHRYTEEQNNFILATNCRLPKKVVDEFNELFGLNFTRDKLESRWYTLTQRKNATSNIGNGYSEDEYKWLRDNATNEKYRGKSFNWDLFLEDYNSIWNRQIKKHTLITLCNDKVKIKVGSSRLGKTGFEMPIGSERKKDGEWYVKYRKRIAGEHKNKCYMRKNRYMYEKYHNVKLTNEDVILFLDGNIDNFEKDNLVKIHKNVSMMCVRHAGWDLCDVNLRKLIIAEAQLRAIIDKEEKDGKENAR